MIIGLILLALVALVATFSYKQSRLELRLIKDIPVTDWMNILIVPVLGYFAMVLVVGNIMDRPREMVFGFDDFSLFAIGLPFLIYAFVGNSIHFVSKVLSRHIRENRHAMVYRINELFHGKLSHYLVWICTFFSFFVVVLLEIDHPLTVSLSVSVQRLIMVAGIALGISAARAIFYTSDWLGGNRSVFLFVFSLYVAQLGLFLNGYLKFGQYPVALFFIFVTGTTSFLFLLRRLFVLLKLNRRQSLRFLTKLMWFQ